MKDCHNENELALLNRLLERLHLLENEIMKESRNERKIEINIYVHRREGDGESKESKEGYREGIRQSIALLMEERVGDEPLFNRQSHWQAVYRILVDKGYCRDSDFDGFDAFICSVMPEKVNKPYRRDSVKHISQTDFNKPFDRWRYESKYSGTRKPFERMCAVAGRFKELLAEKGL